MLTFDLSQVPNQKFSTNINGVGFEFTIQTSRGLLYVSASVNGELVCASARGVPNTSLFPNTVNIPAGGTFQLRCVDDGYPTYEDFDGSTCVFAYIPYGETV